MGTEKFYLIVDATDDDGNVIMAGGKPKRVNTRVYDTKEEADDNFSAALDFELHPQLKIVNE